MPACISNTSLYLSWLQSDLKTQLNLFEKYGKEVLLQNYKLQKLHLSKDYDDDDDYNDDHNDDNNNNNAGTEITMMARTAMTKKKII